VNAPIATPLEPIRAARDLDVLTDVEVARIEAAFGADTSTAELDDQRLPLIAGQGVWGDAPPRGLAYIVSGSVREVILRRPARLGTQDWRRGRDPEVVDVFGAGCFIGLYQLEEVFLRGRYQELPDDEDGDIEETRVYYANPGRRIGAEPLVVRFLPAEALHELLQHEGLRTWLEGMWIGCAMGRRGRRFLREDARRSSRVYEQLASHPILRVLGRASLNALVQSAVPKRPCRPDGTVPDGPSDAFVEGVQADGSWRLAGRPTTDVQLLVQGQAELCCPASASAWWAWCVLEI